MDGRRQSHRVVPCPDLHGGELMEPLDPRRRRENPNLFRRWRRDLLTRWLMPVIARMLPKLGETEREALEAGTVWWDGELFRGSPDWRKLLDFPVAELSDAERAFLDGPVEEICRDLDDWEVFLRGDLPPAIWERLRS